MKSVTNLRAGRLRRNAPPLVPLILVTIALGGVAMRPSLSMEAARSMRAAAQDRAARAAGERDRCAAFTAQNGAERLAAATARIRELLPWGTTALELHSGVRLAAERCGFRLDTVSVDGPIDAGLARLDDLVVRRSVDVRGSGPLPALPALVSLVRSLGYPTAVIEFTVTRASSGPHPFQFQIVLGVFAAAELPPAPPLTVPTGSEGEFQ
ncbi:MAG: hypothetical protein AB1726_04705 [Planctomycetota bacterium]